VTLSFAGPVTAIAPGAMAMRSTSSRPAFSMRSTHARGGASPARPSTSKRGTIEVRAVDIDGDTTGPLPIARDPAAELEPAPGACWNRRAAGGWPSAR